MFLILIFCGVLGTLMALSDVMQWFTSFVHLQGVLFLPVFGVYTAAFIFGQLNLERSIKLWDWNSIAAYGVGVAVGWASKNDWINFSPFWVLESIAAAFVCKYVWLIWIKPQWEIADG